MNSLYHRLWLFVEGDDDERFAHSVLVPLFQGKYGHVDIVQYSQRNKKYRNALMKSITAMGADYLWFRDKDDASCIIDLKAELTNSIPDLSQDRIVVVTKEIEGWYFAGLDDDVCKTMHLSPVSDVDSITKEQFDAIVGGRAKHSATMVEMLKRYDIAIAKQKSASFAYLWLKHVQLGCGRRSVP